METHRKDSTYYKKITISLGEREGIGEERERKLTDIMADMEIKGLSMLLQEIADGNIRLKKRPSFMRGRRFE